MEEELLEQITLDLGANYKSSDEDVLTSIIADVIEEALYIANRHNRTDKETQIKILKTNIVQAVKTIYLQRGTEDVNQSNEGGLNNSYKNAIEEMQQNIIKSGKRVINA